MRNESMKKLGTPIGAGPGSENENVGLLALGTPLPVSGVTFGVVVAGDVPLPFFLPLPFLLPLLLLLAAGAGVVGCGWVEGFSP